VALAACDPSITEVHHLHVWQLASGSRMATLHARLCEGGDAQQAARSIQRMLRERFAITHVTVQVESSECLDTEAGCAEPAHAHDRSRHE
jgi:cobalt-zinc-cadmium efflux system protein